MHLTFWGAAQTVTGSMHLLTVNGHHILLECGLFQGRRAESYERNLNFPFPAESVHAVVLSHAHIDHAGNIPNLIRQGFKGAVYATPATRDLCAAMLVDSGHLHEQDAAYVNKKRARQGEPPVLPLYTAEQAAAAMRFFVALPYGRPFEVAPGVRLTFHDAGHILGSAIVALDLTEDGRQCRLVFSGDLGRPGMPILRDPEPIGTADVLIMESTYGDREHEPEVAAEQRLRDLVVETARQGGKMLIPAFAVGRTQELVYALHRLSDAHQIPSLPIFVDSPLAVDVTTVFRLHPDCYDEETRRFIAHDHDHPHPFGFDRLTYVRDVESSKALNFLEEPAIIIAGSGMCEGGRILHHLKNNIENPRTCVLFVGFQAQNTLGRRLRDGERRVRIFGESYTVRARVEAIDGFSAHADRHGLLAWAAGFDKTRLRHIALVHGEPEPAAALARDLVAAGHSRVSVPARGEQIAL
ncbi:MAG: MBL fold metallo-hydrolase [Caldilineales bacterium]|nr:MBL fold metallo-hydrolase [Caldilineales bacterium]